jgi:pyridoxamine 5'-phosphate oxidase
LSSRAGTLNERTADRDPIRQFEAWLQTAQSAGLPEPTAMTLATATSAGKPSARMVLLKGVDSRGFVFFTNYESRKGREIASNPRAALVFFWAPLGRQVRVTGRVSKVSAVESDAYFTSRPLGSRFGASISRQSSVIESRDVIEKQFAKIAAEYPAGDPLRPKFWGGFRVRPDEIEFWQSVENRLHDRLRYRRLRDGSWKMERLSP